MLHRKKDRQVAAGFPSHDGISCCKIVRFGRTLIREYAGQSLDLQAKRKEQQLEPSHFFAGCGRVLAMIAAPPLPWAQQKWLVTERCHGYRKGFLPLDTSQEPYYCGSKYPPFSAVLPRRPCFGLASARSTRASAANHRESINACQRCDLGVANDNVTLKATDHVCPQHYCARGAPAESRNHRVAGCAQCALLIEQF